MYQVIGSWVYPWNFSKLLLCSQGTGRIFDRLKNLDQTLCSHRTVQYFFSVKTELNFLTCKVVPCERNTLTHEFSTGWKFVRYRVASNDVKKMSLLQGTWQKREKNSYHFPFRNPQIKFPESDRLNLSSLYQIPISALHPPPLITLLKVVIHRLFKMNVKANKSHCACFTKLFNY